MLKNLENDNLLRLEKIGFGKTSTYELKLNWENPLLDKALDFSLTQEALQHQKMGVYFF